MSARNILMAAAGSADDKLYVDDVFSAYTYTGNGSTQTINNGIDLAGKGGMVWTKSRSTDGTHNALYDTVRGTGTRLVSNLTEGASAGDLSAFNSSGFSLNNSQGASNWNGQTYVSWAFRKAPKFFDVVTYTKPALTSDTAFTTTISNPGMVIIKRTSTGNYSEAVNWYVWHRSLGDSQALILNTTDAALGITPVIVSGTAITHRGITSESVQFVAYVFAHDSSTDGIIQCGSFTTDGSGNATVNLGWEPQYILYKRSDSAGGWFVLDSMRGWTNGGNDGYIAPNTAAAENAGSDLGHPTATGFYSKGLAASATYIYLAIRRPNKPPTSGTQVYNAIARTGTGASASVTGVGFAPDMALIYNRDGATGNGGRLIDRLRGSASSFRTDLTASESVLSTMITSFDMNGISLGTNGNVNQSDATFISHFFRRAPGVFDVVCYTGNGATPRPIDHSLGVTPQLAIVKSRNTGGYNWKVTFFDGTSYYYLLLNVDDVSGSYEAHFYGIVNSFTDTNFSVVTDPLGNGISAVNQDWYTYVAYLFASLPGISKVGKYIGNGSTQTINCGFSTGSRFVLIKCMNASGDWYVWDTTRGIITANDPHFSLNSSSAEVTTNDSVDPDSTGFIVNQVAATNVNVSGATYLFLAIA